MTALHQILTHNYPRLPQTTGRPPAMSQSEEIRATLVYHRRNRTQTELAESFGVYQSSICQAISRWTPRIAEALEDFIPTVEDLDPSQTLIVDGTLVPCWNWKTQPALCSGKHHRTGLNLQVASDLTGRLAWVSDPTPGATHDTKALRLTGLLEHFPNTPPVADKGYTGLGMITRNENQPTANSQQRRNNTTEPSVVGKTSVITLLAKGMGYWNSIFFPFNE